MTPRDLLAAFEALSEAPEGTTRLRELILELAVRGKLVPQDPRDEPASALLERMAAKKGRFDEPGALRKQSHAADAVAGPFPVPEAWAWTCTADVGLVSPRCTTNDDAEVGFVPMPVVPTDYRLPVEPERRRWKDIKSGYTHLADGDVAVAKITPCFQNRKSCVVANLSNGIGAGTTELHVVRPFRDLVLPRYLLVFYKTPAFIAGGVAEFTGTAGQQRVPRSYFESAPLPLPPLAEQRRIVARVDELMGLLDRLEAARNSREATRVAVRDAALAALGSADTPEEVAVAWSRVAERKDELFTEPADVQPFRQTVLELAVRGWLVPQDPNDEPVSFLLKRVAADRNRQLAAKATRLGADPGGYDPEGLLPSRWEWAPLQHVVRFIDYRGHTPKKTSSGIRLVTAKNIRDGFINNDPEEFVSPETYTSWMTRGFPKPGDVLFTTEAPMGKAAVVETTERFALAQRAINLQPYADFCGRYLMWVLLSPWFQKELLHRATGMTATGIKGAKLRQIRVPVPPLPEQHRIVAKVDELMGLLDRLEERLAAKVAVHDAFAAAAVHHLDA